MKKLLLLGSIFFCVFSLKAALVFSEDFGALANGTPITTANTALNYARVSTGGGSFVNATNDAFPGASALLFSSSGSLSGIGRTNMSAFTVGTLDFSLRSSGTLSAFDIFLGTGTATFVGNNTFSGNDLTAGFQFVNGQLQTRNAANAWVNVGAVGFGANANYDFSIIFNNSASTVTYGTDTVAAGAADIWVNGSLFGNDVSIRGAQSVTAFRMYTVSSSGPLEVDNIQIFDSALPVPEPSTVAMAMLGGLALLGISMRRNHK